MTNKNEEMVLVAPRELVFKLTEPFLGICTDPHVVTTILKQFSMYHSFERRGDMETDESYKQLIPYVLVRRGDEVLIYRRLGGGGEGRLHGKVSVGFGGHMNDVHNEHGQGVRFKEKVMKNLWRELDEELDIAVDRDECRLNFIGVVNDDDDPLETGKYHLGLVAVLDIPEDAQVNVREDDAHAIRFIKADRLVDVRDEAEAWSVHLIDWIGGRGA